MRRVDVFSIPNNVKNKQGPKRMRRKAKQKVNSVARLTAQLSRIETRLTRMPLAARGQKARGRSSTNYDIAVARRTGIAPMRLNGRNSNTITVHMTEQLTDVTTVALTGAVAKAIVIAPTVLSTRNATFNYLYELVHIDKVEFKYIPNSSTAIPGNIATLVDYNANEGASPTTLASASQREGVQRHHAWESFSHIVKWKDMADKTAMVDSNKSTSHRPDGQVYTFCLIVEGGPTSGATLLGWIEASVTYIYTGLKAAEAP